MKKVSVSIPCRNEAKYIRGCVESILSSNYSPLEVIVVDGMSDDGTRTILEELKSEYSNFSYVDNPEQLTPYAFNYGVKNSDGFYIQIVGSRNILEPNYIPSLVKTLEEEKDIACVGGDYRHVYDTDIAKYISMAMESKFGVGSSNYRTMKTSCYVDTVGVPMYRKSIFDEIGYFDERLTRNQDDDFNYRVTQKGYKIYYNAEAKCTYFVRASLKKLFKQMSQYGYFKVFVNKKHKTVTTSRQLVPAAFLLFLTLGGALSIAYSPLVTTYFSVILLYLLIGFMTSFKESKKIKGSLIMQLCIFIMHIGYGFGYLKGIWHFLILNKLPSSKMKIKTT